MKEQALPCPAGRNRRNRVNTAVTSESGHRPGVREAGCLRNDDAADEEGWGRVLQQVEPTPQQTEEEEEIGRLGILHEIEKKIAATGPASSNKISK